MAFFVSKIVLTSLGMCLAREDSLRSIHLISEFLSMNPVACALSLWLKSASTRSSIKPKDPIEDDRGESPFKPTSASLSPNKDKSAADAKLLLCPEF